MGDFQAWLAEIPVRDRVEIRDNLENGEYNVDMFFPKGNPGTSSQQEPSVSEEGPGPQANSSTPSPLPVEADNQGQKRQASPSEPPGKRMQTAMQTPRRKTAPMEHAAHKQRNTLNSVDDPHPLLRIRLLAEVDADSKPVIDKNTDDKADVRTCTYTLSLFDPKGQEVQLQAPKSSILIEHGSSCKQEQTGSHGKSRSFLQSMKTRLWDFAEQLSRSLSDSHVLSDPSCFRSLLQSGLNEAYDKLEADISHAKSSGDDRLNAARVIYKEIGRLWVESLDDLPEMTSPTELSKVEGGSTIPESV